MDAWASSRPNSSWEVAFGVFGVTKTGVGYGLGALATNGEMEATALV